MNNNSIHKQIINLKKIVKTRDSELLNLKQAIQLHLKLTKSSSDKQTASLQNCNNEDPMQRFPNLRSSMPISKVSSAFHSLLKKTKSFHIYSILFYLYN